MKKLLGLCLTVLAFAACNSNKQEAETPVNIYDTIFQVHAVLETTPVNSVSGEDAADDPSIWFNNNNPAKSRIIGTNKKRGICVYDLNGTELFFYPVGKVNNIDVRYNFNLNGKMVDIVGASNRSTNTITLMAIQPDSGYLIPVNARPLVSEVDEVYGFCLYHNKAENKHYAFVNGKNGMLEQWELFATANQLIDAKIVRKMSVGSQPEGMVADDELNNLFVGEEDKGVWLFSALANADSSKTLIAESDTTNTNIAYDIEGLAIYYAANQQGYLIVSSQGNNSYALFNRAGNHEYMGSFSVNDESIDGTEETDGLDVINASLGANFPMGLFIAQDGYNFDGDSLKTQNFKLVSWEQIARNFQDNLLMDTVFQIN
jgi:3-phytase